MSEVNIRQEDMVLVVSTSGRNPVSIDVVEIAKQQGAFVIAITSKIYKQTQSSRHKNGWYLEDVADLTLDNHIMVGDTLMQHKDFDGYFGSGSTIINMAIVNGMMVKAVEVMIQNNIEPPIFKSGNIDGSEEHNRKLVNAYKHRIPMLER